jgi:N-acetylmuramoyl-L-alanine amidase
MLFIYKMIKIRVIFTISLLFFICISASNGTYKEPYRIKTIVIDPGHGGHDSGCLGASSKEKQIALEVALKLGEMITQKYPDVKVIYTRKTDEFVELHERAAIANRNHAELFICIHCNSGSPAAFGAETYVMGLHKTEDNLNVAKRENAAVLLEKDYKQKYDGFDPNSPEANIVFTLYQNAYLTQSLKFASAVQQQFEVYAGRYNRGVKQAGFLVLYKTAMPSVLIETGFLTNRTEEKYLLTEKGQNAIASSIFRAFMEYKLDMETPGAKIPQSGAENDLNKNILEVKNNDNQSDKETTQPPQKATDSEKNTATPNNTKENQEVKKETVKKNTDTPVTQKETHPTENNKTETTVKPIASKEKVIPSEVKKENANSDKLPDFFYTVQLAAMPEASKEELKRFEDMPDINTFKAENGMTRVCQGVFTTHAKALAVQSQLRAKGYKDAFVTPYYKGKRISNKEAEAIKK